MRTNLLQNKTRAYAYALTLVPGLITLWGNTMGGFWAWSNVIFVLGVVNSLEWIMGQRRNNEAVSESALPDLYVVLALPMVIAGILTLLWGTYTGALEGSALLGAVLSTGFFERIHGHCCRARNDTPQRTTWKRPEI
ncbi:MAG: hypothetical protein EBQ67_08535, partial [Sphingobacteriia bacterium]|nr:hypothetical protein [Sphingobacteriia bacterium]